MTKHEYRKRWMRVLREREGSTKALALKTGLENNYISSLLGPSSKRQMGDPAARRVEKAYGLTTGALDLPSEAAQRLVKVIDGMDESALDDVINYALFRKGSKWDGARQVASPTAKYDRRHDDKTNGADD